MNPCQRCESEATTTLHTGFGLEHLCAGCRDAVRQDGQEIAAPYPLSIEDFAAWQSWREFIRLSSFCVDMRRQLAYRMRLSRSGDWLTEAGRRTEWASMVERWYRQYRADDEVSVCAAA